MDTKLRILRGTKSVDTETSAMHWLRRTTPTDTESYELRGTKLLGLLTLASLCHRPTDRAYTPTIHRPYDSADTPAIHDLPLASYCYDNDCTALPTVQTTDRADTPAIYKPDNDYAALPIVRPTIVPLCLRSTRQPIDELCARPLSLPPLVPYYYPNRLLLLLPAAYLIRHSLLCLQHYNRQLLLRLQLSRFDNCYSTCSTTADSCCSTRS
jgi:hypothetical protein